MAQDASPPGWLSERCAVFWQRTAADFQRAWRTVAPAGKRGPQVINDIGKTTVARLRAISLQTLAYRHWKLLLFIVAVIMMVGIIWKVPQWQAASWQGQMEPKELAKLQNDARTTLVQALGGAVLLIGLYLTFRNLQLTQDRQITEHYTRAVEQLGSDKLAVRLGAIYALERIARDSERDHWPIMEILTAYVRDRASISVEPPSQEEMQSTETLTLFPKPTIDIQAVLTVLGRRARTHGRGEDQWLDLRSTNLRGAILREAHLERALLTGTHLERANLVRAHLERAFLTGAHLERAVLREAHLEKADLINARLEDANLVQAHLEGATLGATSLKGASLSGSNLEAARGLTVEQLSTVYTLYGAHLDPPLLKQIPATTPTASRKTLKIKGQLITHRTLAYSRHPMPVLTPRHRIGPTPPLAASRPSESEAVTSGKVVTHRMEKQSVAISAVLGIFTDLGQFELLEKPL